MSERSSGYLCHNEHSQFTRVQSNRNSPKMPRFGRCRFAVVVGDDEGAPLLHVLLSYEGKSAMHPSRVAASLFQTAGEGGIPLHSHIPHSVSHVPARAQWRLSLLHLAPLSRLSLQLSLSPFLFRFSQTNTDRHEGEEEFDARQRQRLSVSSLGEICARFSHNPHDIRHIRQTQRRTLRAWEWRVLLSSLFLPPHPLPRPFLFRLACLL